MKKITNINKLGAWICPGCNECIEGRLSEYIEHTKDCEEYKERQNARRQA